MSTSGASNADRPPVHSCQNELRLCFQNNDLDQTFQDGLKSWHSLCDTYVTRPPTTAPDVTVTPGPGDFCIEVVRRACSTARILVNDCTRYLTGDDAPFTSCICGPELLRNAYTCEFVGNTTCLSVPATIESVVGYTCDNFQAAIGTNTVSLGPKLSSPAVAIS